ncbi:MAG: hypothetical protein J0M07_12955 [Anaerolineae bacterium]|nr:hypothetical protein [Anaerolineae bacterium]
MNAKKFGVTVVLVGALAGGALVAQAQENPPPADPQAQDGQPGPMGGRGGRGGQMGGDQRGGRLGEDRQIYLMQAVMDATGLNLIEVSTQVRDGATLGEIVTANGGSIDAVVADAVAGATEAINQAVANGRLTQEQADQALARITEVFTNVLTGEARDQALNRVMDVGIVQLAAEQTGVNPRDLAQQLRDGAALATILTDNGVDVTAFVTEATERAQARINLQVAEDRITAEQAAELMAQFSEQLNTLLNATTPAL